MDGMDVDVVEGIAAGVTGIVVVVDGCVVDVGDGTVVVVVVVVVVVMVVSMMIDSAALAAEVFPAGSVTRAETDQVPLVSVVRSQVVSVAGS